jgi:hypothetical protein
MHNWLVNYQKNVIFSAELIKTESWVDIYDWCNQQFNAEHWHFWYDVLNEHAIQIFFEFTNEANALEFQEKWNQK